MSPDGTADTPADANAAEATEETAADRRRRRELVFGDVLPDGTSDERGDGGSERDGAAERGARSEEWLRRQVPPHHG